MAKGKRSTGPTPRQRLGARGEALAAQALTAAGYRVIMPDVRSKSGQVDILAEQDGDLVFVEVKTRSSTAFGVPAEAITPAKQRHLIAAAQEYLAQHEIPDHPWRIDVVCILMVNGKPEIEIIRHAVGEQA
jgi:putative endonuclease